MIDKKTWQEFRETGLLLIINQFLHIFGWSIVFSFDDKTGELKEVFPARTKFRGFAEQDVSESYSNITNYLSDNIEDIKNDLNG